MIVTSVFWEGNSGSGSLNELPEAVVLKLAGLKTNTAGPYPWGLGFSRSGVEPENLHFKQVPR